VSINKALSTFIQVVRYNGLSIVRYFQVVFDYCFCNSYCVFFIVRNKIIVHLKINHTKVYDELFFICEDKSVEIRDVGDWSKFTSEGYKDLNDNYLFAHMPRQNILGIASIVLLFLLLVVVGIQDKIN
jgi:hypothetical protein